MNLVFRWQVMVIVRLMETSFHQLLPMTMGGVPPNFLHPPPVRTSAGIGPSSLPTAGATRLPAAHTAGDASQYNDFMKWIGGQTIKGKLMFPDLPTAATTPTFQKKLATNLQAVSRITDGSIVGWTKEIWSGKTFEELSLALCPQDKKHLDQELAAAAELALTAGKPGVPAELSRRVERRSNELIFGSGGTLMSGRQYVYLVLDFFRTDSGLTKAYTVENLMAARWMGDDRADEFLGQWDRITSNFSPSQLEAVEQKKGSDAGIKQELFAVQVGKSNIPTLHHAHCDYLVAKDEVDSPKFTYEFLRKAVQSAVDRKQLSKQQEAERKELQRMASGGSDTRLNRDNRLAPAVDGKGARHGKDAPKNPLSSEERKKNGPCWFHAALTHAGATKPCKSDKLCRFSHESISKAEFDKLPVPRPRSMSPKGKDRAAKGGGRGGKQNDFICGAWKRTGICAKKDNGCAWAHPDKFKGPPKAAEPPSEKA